MKQHDQLICRLIIDASRVLAGLIRGGQSSESATSRLLTRKSVVLLLLGSVAAVAMGAEIGSVFLPSFPVRWEWLNQHPNRLGLLASTALIFTGTGWAITDEKRRSTFAIPFLIAIVVALVTILGK